MTSARASRRTVKRYDITSANDVPTRDPKDWQLLGSNDGSTGRRWILALASPVGRTATRRSPSPSPLPARIATYRLNVTANNGATGTQLSELAFYASDGHTIPNGTYRIVCRRSSRALDVQNGRTDNGAPLVQWGVNSANSQKWTLTDQGNGQYKITNVPSGG